MTSLARKLRRSLEIEDQRGANPVRDAFSVVNDALQGPRRPAINVDDMAERAKLTAAAVIDRGADKMVRQPWRITRAVYHDGTHSGWPLDDKTATDVLADCREGIANQTELGRAGSWVFDFNRLVALQQAEKALEKLLT